MSNGQRLVNILSRYVGHGGTKFWNDYGCAHGTAWCVIAVWDTFRMAGLSEYFYDGKKVAYVPYAQQWLHKHCKHVKMKNARAGDVVIFTWDGNGYNSERGSRDHIGFIRKKGTSSTAYTIEGNTSGGIVARRTRPACYIYGIYRPKYPSSSSKKKSSSSSKKKSSLSKKKSKKKSSLSKKKSKYSTGMYVVKASNGLNVRKGPSVKYKRTQALPKGTKLKILKVRGGWGYSKGAKGWVSLKYCRRA